MTTEQEQTYLAEIERVIEAGPYHADWNSLTENEPPKWFRDAKFGIFVHWGLYSIPAHNNEWYSRNMYIQDGEEWEYHRRTFGPHTEFGYKEFIPLFRAEQFDAAAWMKLFQKSGARYVFPVAEHHDGFQMYRSELSEYNSWNMGPKRDILGELKDAAEKEGIVFCTSSHRAEHWFFMGHGKEAETDVKEPMKRGDFYWPAMPEPDHQELCSRPYPSEEFLNDWLLRNCELIDRYQPALLYFDWWIQHDAFKEVLKKTAAYYYNRSVQWGRPASVCYKHDAMMFGSGIPDVERGALAQTKSYVWQTDTAIAKNSWCYTDSLEYKSVRQIICQFVEVIARNGNLLLNIGPRGDGSIPERDFRMLEEIGAWMRKNSQAIYGSRPWKIPAEGPTRISEGQFTDHEECAYTVQDVRFTANGDSIYAFVMRYPEDGAVCIQSLAKTEDQNTAVFHGLIRNVCLLGSEETVRWQQDIGGLHLHADVSGMDLPAVFKITMK